LFFFVRFGLSSAMSEETEVVNFVEKYISKYKVSSEETILGWLNETERAAAEEMRALCEEEKYSIAFLVRFLVVKKFNVTESMKLLKNHMAFREKYCIPMEPYSSPHHFHEMGFQTWIPGTRTRKGNAVVYVRLRNAENMLNDPNLSMVEYFRYAYFMFDLLLDREGLRAQKKGFVVIEDLSDLSLSFFKQMLTSGHTRELLNTQDALSFRLKKVYILNAPWYFSWILACVRPFLKKKLADRIANVDLDQLKEIIDEDMLWSEFGGNFQFDPLNPNIYEGSSTSNGENLQK